MLRARCSRLALLLALCASVVSTSTGAQPLAAASARAEASSIVRRIAELDTQAIAGNFDQALQTTQAWSADERLAARDFIGKLRVAAAASATAAELASRGENESALDRLKEARSSL